MGMTSDFSPHAGTLYSYVNRLNFGRVGKHQTVTKEEIDEKEMSVLLYKY